MKTKYLDMEETLFNENRNLILSKNFITNSGFRELSSNVCYLWNATSNVVQICVFVLWSSCLLANSFIHSIIQTFMNVCSRCLALNNYCFIKTFLLLTLMRFVISLRELTAWNGLLLSCHCVWFLFWKDFVMFYVGVCVRNLICSTRLRSLSGLNELLVWGGSLFSQRQVCFLSNLSSIFYAGYLTKKHENVFLSSIDSTWGFC